jgi:hypothetical protein
VSAPAPRVIGPYKFVELSVVTDDTLEECVNEWVTQGWHLDRIHFVTTDASRRPGMAFVGFVRAAGAAPASAPAPGAKPGSTTAPLGLAARLAAHAAEDAEVASAAPTTPTVEPDQAPDLVAPSALRGQRRAATPTVPGRRRSGAGTLPGRAGERGGGKR